MSKIKTSERVAEFCQGDMGTERYRNLIAEVELLENEHTQLYVALAKGLMELQKQHVDIEAAIKALQQVEE